MIKNNQFGMKVFISLCVIFSNTVWAAGEGITKPSTINLTTKGIYYSQPTYLTSIIESDSDAACQLDSSDGGFTSAEAKWSQFKQVGTINIEGVNYPIQETGIPGIGAVVRLAAQYNNNIDPSTTSQIIDGEYKTITASPSDGSAAVFLGKKYWALVALANQNMVPGIYENELGSNQTGVDIRCVAKNSENNTYSKVYLQGTVVINAATCDMSEAENSHIPISLGEHSSSAINKLAINETFGSAVKNISLNCSAGAFPSLIVTDNNNLNASDTSIIELTESSKNDDIGSAQGVGVQVFINGKTAAQQLNSPVNLVNNRLKEETVIPIDAEFRYVKTSKNVGAGAANAVVNFTFVYN